MTTAVCAPACTAELMRIGPSYHEQPGAYMLVLSDKSASPTWSAGYTNTLFTQVYTITVNVHILVTSIHHIKPPRVHVCMYVCVDTMHNVVCVCMCVCVCVLCVRCFHR